jgi:hypothetical protein
VIVEDADVISTLVFRDFEVAVAIRTEHLVCLCISELREMRIMVARNDQLMKSIGNLSLIRAHTHRLTACPRLQCGPVSDSGRDGLLYSIKIDTAKSNFSIAAEESQERVTVEEENEIKRAIRDKMKELEAKGELKGPDDA